MDVGRSAYAENVTVMQKVASATVPSVPLSDSSGSAETSVEAIERGQNALTIFEAERKNAELELDDESASAFDELGFTTAVLDVPVPGERPMPMPPRRPVPHHLVCATLADAAVNNDIPAPFMIRLIWQESRFRQNAVSPVGAQGVAQFMPRTAAAMGLSDPFNPLDALRASAALLRELVGQFGNVGLAAAAYNAGPKRVQDWLAKRGSLPKETRDYVQIITGVAPEHWRAQASAPAIRVAKQVPCQREAGLLAANGPERIPLPPVAQTEIAKPADKTVQVVAALSQKRKGDKAAAPAATASKDQTRLAAAPDKKTVKAQPKAAIKVAEVKEAPAGSKTAKQAADKRETKTVSARSKTEKPAAKGKGSKVAEAK